MVSALLLCRDKVSGICCVSLACLMVLPDDLGMQFSFGIKLTWELSKCYLIARLIWRPVRILEMCFTWSRDFSFLFLALVFPLVSSVSTDWPKDNSLLYKPEVCLVLRLCIVSLILNGVFTETQPGPSSWEYSRKRQGFRLFRPQNSVLVAKSPVSAADHRIIKVGKYL